MKSITMVKRHMSAIISTAVFDRKDWLLRDSERYMASECVVS